MHFEDAKRKEERDETDRRNSAAKRKWGKTPSAIPEPSSSPGTSSTDTAAVEERCMAVSAYPTHCAAEGKVKKQEDGAKMTAQTPEKDRSDTAQRFSTTYGEG